MVDEIRVADIRAKLIDLAESLKEMSGDGTVPFSEIKRILNMDAVNTKSYIEHELKTVLTETDNPSWYRVLNDPPKIIERDGKIYTSDKKPVFTFFEMLEKPSPPEWIIKHIIPAKGLIIVGGSPGCGKSLICQALARLIAKDATEEKLFDKFNVDKHGIVMIVDQENSWSLIYERLTKLGGVDMGKLTYCFSNFDFMNPMAIEELQNAIKEYHPTMIIFDTLRRSHSGNENDSAVMNTIYNEVLGPLAEDMAVVLIHHKRKGSQNATPADEIDEFRGSSDIVGCAEVVYSVRKNVDGTISVKCPKMRGAKEPESFLLRIDDECNTCP